MFFYVKLFACIFSLITLSGCWCTFNNGKVLEKGKAFHGFASSIVIPERSYKYNKKFSDFLGYFVRRGIGKNMEISSDVYLAEIRLGFKYQILEENKIFPASSLMMKYGLVTGSVEPIFIFSKEIIPWLNIYAGVKLFVKQSLRLRILDAKTGDFLDSNIFTRYFMGFEFDTSKDRNKKEIFILELTFPAIYIGGFSGITSYMKYENPQIGFAFVIPFEKK